MTVEEDTYDLDDIRGAIVAMTSAMLDNPNEYGIYPTTKFYDRMEAYIQAQIEKVRNEEAEHVVSTMKDNLVTCYPTE